MHLTQAAKLRQIFFARNNLKPLAAEIDRIHDAFAEGHKGHLQVHVEGFGKLA